MIRIITKNEPNATTITIDGRLAGDGVQIVETCIRQAIGERGPVHLYLRNVTHIDERGRGLLRRLASQGVELSASGVYSSYVVTEICQSLAQTGRGSG